MALLSDALRRQLEKTVIEARDVGEAGARAVTEHLAVQRPEPFAEMVPAERELRVQLRAHARQLGDPRKEGGEQETLRLVSECGYEHWHRMLFARFLAENGLLMHPEHDVPVTLAECEELAAEAGEQNGWALAGRFAARMLPAIFRPDDPVLRARLAPEHQQILEGLLAQLPPAVFASDDGLGWVYQFWQTKRNAEINQTGNRIGADELPAVTQFFTEPYMVRFLLHNTLGAWWAQKVLAERPELSRTAANEDELRKACALAGNDWGFLRFVREGDEAVWRPAAGPFDSWPERAADITVLDPCCGSGHFLVEAFRILVSIRMTEEHLTARDAADAVLRDNLFGLEVDERCTQIAAFNLALAAWIYPEAGGYRSLPDPHIACSGMSVGAKEEEWLKLAGQDERLRQGMRRLYQLFRDAPMFGSLIDARREFAAKPGTLEFEKGRFEDLQPLLARALAREEVLRDAAATEAGIAAQGMARAATLLAQGYTLVSTNVPFLFRTKQTDRLREYCGKHFAEGAQDLSSVFVQRCLELSAIGGTVALVTPQNWLSLVSYEEMRRKVLSTATLKLVVSLGPASFRDMNWWAANTALVVISKTTPAPNTLVTTLDASTTKIIEQKAAILQVAEPATSLQLSQLANPDARILVSGTLQGVLLEQYAEGLQGIATADYDRFGRCFWETPHLLHGWIFQQSTVGDTAHFGGREHVLFWENGAGELSKSPSARVQGLAGWRKQGVTVSQMRMLPVTRYTGEAWDNNAAVLVPKTSEHLPAIWTFCSSPDFLERVRRLDKQAKVTNATLTKVPFELDRWQQEAARRFPQGLPEAYSDDPTQWIFHGHPLPCAAGPTLEPPWSMPGTLDTKRPFTTQGAASVLHVATARLLGYRWPAELDSAMAVSSEARAWIAETRKLLDPADVDGIVCIPPVRGEQPAADRLHRLLALAFGAAWTPTMLSSLLDHVGFAGKTLEDWLRDGFFDQHCQLFHQRPFIWHIWDGRRRDGFAALVNYHKLDRKLLERLTYTVLGDDWIGRQRQGAKAAEPGAEDRLATAEALHAKLVMILQGEPPYDIFVRWKPLAAQPIGWEPDLNDGVRMNIRPFAEAGVLRKTPRIKWTKDRGVEPEGFRPANRFPWFWKDGQYTGERMNNLHYTTAQKRVARERGRLQDSAK